MRIRESVGIIYPYSLQATSTHMYICIKCHSSSSQAKNTLSEGETTQKRGQQKDTTRNSVLTFVDTFLVCLVQRFWGESFGYGDYKQLFAMQKNGKVTKNNVQLLFLNTPLPPPSRIPRLRPLYGEAAKHRSLNSEPCHANDSSWPRKIWMDVIYAFE